MVFVLQTIKCIVSHRERKSCKTKKKKVSVQKTDHYSFQIIFMNLKKIVTKKIADTIHVHIKP